MFRRFLRNCVQMDRHERPCLMMRMVVAGGTRAKALGQPQGRAFLLTVIITSAGQLTEDKRARPLFVVRLPERTGARMLPKLQVYNKFCPSSKGSQTA
jgi:hypothetical protein